METQRYGFTNKSRRFTKYNYIEGVQDGIRRAGSFRRWLDRVEARQLRADRRQRGRSRRPPRSMRCQPAIDRSRRLVPAPRSRRRPLHVTPTAVVETDAHF